MSILACFIVSSAVIAKERELHKEYQEQLRQADKENAKFLFLIR